MGNWLLWLRSTWDHVATPKWRCAMKTKWSRWTSAWTRPSQSWRSSWRLLCSCPSATCAFTTSTRVLPLAPMSWNTAHGPCTLTSFKMGMRSWLFPKKNNHLSPGSQKKLYLNNQIHFELAPSKLHRVNGTLFQGNTSRICWGFSLAHNVSCHYTVTRPWFVCTFAFVAVIKGFLSVFRIHEQPCISNACIFKNKAHRRALAAQDVLFTDFKTITHSLKKMLHCTDVLKKK